LSYLGFCFCAFYLYRLKVKYPWVVRCK